MKIHHALFATLIVISASVCAAREPGSADRARAALAGFDTFVDQAIRDWNTPGAAIAIVRGGEVVMARGFGSRDLAAGLPVTENTLFAIGSTTKAFTTTTLGTLVDSGDLDWDAPLNDYLPSFRLADAVVTQMLTPRDLVTHRSGLPRHDLVWYNKNDGTRSELVARLQYLDLSAGLRTKYQYNNLMFLTAGYLTEMITGEPWEDAVRRLLLEPLGMDSTNFSVLDSQKSDDFSRGYREDDDQKIELVPFRRLELMAPAGSINSSAADMAKWLLFNLNGGRAGDAQVITASTLSDIQSPHMTIDTIPDRVEISQAAYGMGWRIDTYRGHRRVSHGGAIDGFTAGVVLFPDDDLGLFAVTNRGSDLRRILNQHAADRILELDPIDWNAEGLQDRADALTATREAKAKKGGERIEGTAPSHQLSDYAAEYEHPGYGTLAVDLEGETLSILFNGIRAPLEHWHYDVWTGAQTDGDSTFEDRMFQFRSDVDGSISTVESPLEARVNPIVFRKRPSSILSDRRYLVRLTGQYELPGQTVGISLSGSVLSVTLPGQPVYTLEPALNERFKFKEIPVISVGFDTQSAGPATAITFYQPNGVFRAERTQAGPDADADSH